MAYSATKISRPISRRLTSSVGDAVMAAVPSRTYQTESTTLFAAMTVQPTTFRKNTIDDVIIALKAAGVWAKLDFLHVLAAHDAQAARINWKNPAQIGTVVATCTFTTDRGYQGDGTTGHIDTGLNISTLTNYRQDNAHIGGWCANETSGANIIMVGCITYAGISLNPRTGTSAQTRLNNGTNTNTAGAAVSKGHTVMTRSVAANYDVYKTGSLLGNVVQTSVAVTSGIVSYLRFTTFYDSLHQVAAGHGGSSLNSTEIGNLYNALNTYMTAVGAAP